MLITISRGFDTNKLIEPAEILIPLREEDAAIVESFLDENRGFDVSVTRNNDGVVLSLRRK